MKKTKTDNATCIICGKKYHLCIACERTKSNWKYWKILTDTENCYNIYKVLNDYNFGKISKNEARALLEAFDLKELETFKEDVRARIKDIIEDEKETKLTKTKMAKKTQNKTVVD